MVNSSGYNPGRRSKNIGTAAQGFKKRTAFGIPSQDRDSRQFYEKLSRPTELSYQLGSHQFSLLIEPTSNNFKYYVSASDIIEMLKLIPETDRKDIKIIVLRQPKRKEYIFNPVWGRMAYWAEIGQYSGAAVVIEAIPSNYSYKIEKSVSPDFMKEVEALRNDVHHIEITKRSIEITCPPEAIRRTQLFRTLPHEIGHYVDYKQKVLDAPCNSASEYDTLNDLYFARPLREREAFADRYAISVLEPFRNSQIIPFTPLPNRDDSGLNAEWFYFDPPSDIQTLV